MVTFAFFRNPKKHGFLFGMFEKRGRSGHGQKKARMILEAIFWILYGIMLAKTAACLWGGSGTISLMMMLGLHP